MWTPEKGQVLHADVIRLTCRSGVELYTALREAVALAVIEKCDVEFLFSGYPMRVEYAKILESLASRYWAERGRPPSPDAAVNP